MEVVLDHRDRVVQTRLRGVETLRHVCFGSVGVLFDLREPSAVRRSQRLAGRTDLVQALDQRVRCRPPGTVEIGREGVDERGRGRLVESTACEPIRDQAFVEQGRQEQGLVHRVARASLERAACTPQDPRIWLVADLVRHELEDPFGVVREVVREVADGVGRGLSGGSDGLAWRARASVPLRHAGAADQQQHGGEQQHRSPVPLGEDW